MIDDDDIIARPSEAQGYLVAAQGMLAGALPLIHVTPLPDFALTLLCGHSCEAALKAILSQQGATSTKLSRRPYGHNILNLWRAVEDLGLQLPNPLPPWLAQLDRVYDKPFHLRYPLGFHIIALPNQDAMLAGTASLVSLAQSEVR